MHIKHTKNISTKVKVLAAFFLGSTLTGSAVYAATILFNADQVGFNNTNTSLSSTDVQGALNELYTKTSTWIDPAKTMQTFDKTKYLPNVNDSATLTDLRDGNTYTVKRLADGNVWMTQNLRIINTTLTPVLSDVSSNFTIPVSSTSGFVARDNNSAYIDSTYGGYYSFYTATASTGNVSLTSGNASSSICPRGWRLPIGNTSGDFQTLYNYYNSSELMQGAPGFVLPGSVYDGSIRNQGSRGSYWSSTVFAAGGNYFLELQSTSANPASASYIAESGNPVRCLAR